MMSKDETLKLSAALKEVKEDKMFWIREVYEFCKRGKGKGKDGDGSRPPKTSWEKPFKKGAGKPDWYKGKGKGAKSKGWDSDGKGGKGKHKKGAKGAKDWNNQWTPQVPPSSPAATGQANNKTWAIRHSDASEFCKKYHAFNNCTGGCGRSHACPFLLATGSACEKEHRAMTNH